MKMCVPSTRILIEFVFIRWYNCAAHYRSMAEWNEWLSWFHRIGVKASILFGRGDNKDCAGCYESVEPDTTTVYLRPKVADHATKKTQCYTWVAVMVVVTHWYAMLVWSQSRQPFPAPLFVCVQRRIWTVAAAPISRNFFSPVERARCGDAATWRWQKWKVPTPN